MAVLFVPGSYAPEEYLPPIKRLRPDLDIRVWPEAGAPADITFALVHNPPPGALRAFPNLKAIGALTAGINRLLADSELPDVPLARMVNPMLAHDMAHYVLLHVLRYVRHMPLIAAAQRRREWIAVPPPARSAAVGLMGLGQMGGAAARALLTAGLEVQSWTRRPNEVAGVRTYAGRLELSAFLGRTNILACLLPLTPETERIIDRALLAQLPQGSFLINAARGGHVVDEDLLAALDSGQLAGATLDVFADEPLPPGNPYWDHPKVTMTHHSASDPDPESIAPLVVENIRRAEAGEPLLYAVDRAQGY
jgi:glyoxylate/hydroxypyruvate reductase A